VRSSAEQAASSAAAYCAREGRVCCPAAGRDACAAPSFSEPTVARHVNDAVWAMHEAAQRNLVQARADGKARGAATVVLCREVGARADAEEAQAVSEAKLAELTMKMEKQGCVAAALQVPTHTEVCSLFHRTWTDLGTHPPEIVQVVRLPAGLADGKEHIARSNPELLWHGTACLCTDGSCGEKACSLCCISHHGFSQRAARSTTASYREFGRATWFAATASTCHEYAGRSERPTPDSMGMMRAVILSEVQLGVTFVTQRIGAAERDKMTAAAAAASNRSSESTFTSFAMGPPDGYDSVVVMPDQSVGCRGVREFYCDEGNDDGVPGSKDPWNRTAQGIALQQSSAETSAHVLVSDSASRVVPLFVVWYEVPGAGDARTSLWPFRPPRFSKEDGHFCEFHNAKHGCEHGCECCEACGCRPGRSRLPSVDRNDGCVGVMCYEYESQEQEKS
jgi:hypothetical protein